jgi:hypothetical protein
MATSKDDPNIIEGEAIPRRELIPRNVRLPAKDARSEPYTLEILASLLLGGALEGSEQLSRRLRRWQDTTTSQSSQIYSESRDESPEERLRYAVVGLLSEAPAVAQGTFLAAVDMAAAAYGLFSAFLGPVTHSPPMRPVLRRYNDLAARGTTVVDRWIDAGRTAEQHSRALARHAAFDGEDEVIEEVVGKLAQEPALRELVSQQSLSMADELKSALRTRAYKGDQRWERRVRSLFGRR